MTNKTTNKDGTPRKTGSGRKKGAKSFVNVTLADLQKFCGAAAAIPVSRVWLEQIGATIGGDVQTPDWSRHVADSVAAEPEAEQKISFTLHK